MPSAFVRLARRGSSSRRAVAAEAAARPLRVYRSWRADFLDTATALPANPAQVISEPVAFRQLVREWHDRDTVGELTEAIHRMDLARAAVQPVIEVTVITPPGGIRRSELARLVQERMAQEVLAVPDQAPTREIPAIQDHLPTQVIPAIRDDTEVIEVRVP